MSINIDSELTQTKHKLDELLCLRLNEALHSISVTKQHDPKSVAAFYCSDVPYCRLHNGDRLSVQYDINPILINGTIQVSVTLESVTYGTHAIKLLMDLDMLNLYKTYITLLIDVALHNEQHRILMLIDQPKITH